MPKKMELVAPAGGPEQLKYALQFGADAVYLAAGRFGMRQRARNFTLDEMPRVVEYVHAHGAKVYVACNIIMHEADIESLPRYLAIIQDASADALIIGDLGAARLARRYAPKLAIHVSTQASVSNVESALSWMDLGASRIVCAREMSLDAIAHMHAKLDNELELEAFVHGAMCMAYSGRCLISDYMTGRSALQGNCTQPCRWSYALVEQKRPGQYFGVEQTEKESFIFNSQDLDMLSHLDDMRDAGIDAIKIEGRNKKAFYVSCVVNAYRHVLDGADPKDWEPELEAVSHRPYSTGFYYGPAHQTSEKDGYVRRYEWVAQIEQGLESPDSLYSALAVCRNRFAVGDDLEIVSDQRNIEHTRVYSIAYVPEPHKFPEYTLAVPVAKRAMAVYRIRLDAPTRPGDILRIRRENS